MQLETTTKVPVELLRLDPGNPRLIGDGNDITEEAIIARLYRAAELNELLESISTNGYLDIEPLVVMEDPDPDGGRLIVLEGNRRLAALRLLREPDLAGAILSREGLRISVPPVAEPLRETFDSSVRVPGREPKACPILHRLQAYQRSREVGRLCQGSFRGEVVQGGTC